MALNFLKSREPGKIQRQCREGIGKATGDKHHQAGSQRIQCCHKAVLPTHSDTFLLPFSGHLLPFPMPTQGLSQGFHLMPSFSSPTRPAMDFH